MVSTPGSLGLKFNMLSTGLRLPLGKTKPKYKSKSCILVIGRVTAHFHNVLCLIAQCNALNSLFTVLDQQQHRRCGLTTIKKTIKNM